MSDECEALLVYLKPGQTADGLEEQVRALGNDCEWSSVEEPLKRPPMPSRIRQKDDK